MANSIDGLNVPLPSAVTQNIIERNSSQNLSNLPEVVLDKEVTPHNFDKICMRPFEKNKLTLKIKFWNFLTPRYLTKYNDFLGVY